MRKLPISRAGWPALFCVNSAAAVCTGAGTPPACTQKHAVVNTRSFTCLFPVLRYGTSAVLAACKAPKLLQAHRNMHYINALVTNFTSLLLSFMMLLSVQAPELLLQSR